MEEKRISYDIFMSVKRVYQACNPLISKRASAKAKMDKLQKEYESYDTQISALEAGIKSVTGFRVEELVKKVVEDTGKVDPKTGKTIKTTKFLPTDIVRYDSEKRQYVITIPENRTPENSNYAAENAQVVEEKPQENIQTPESVWGSDYDIDKEEPNSPEPVGMDVFE